MNGLLWKVGEGLKLLRGDEEKGFRLDVVPYLYETE